MSIENDKSPAQKNKVGAALTALSKRVQHILRGSTKTGLEETHNTPFDEFLRAFATQTRALQAPAKYAKRLVDEHRDTDTPFWVAIEKELEITRENSIYALEIIRPFRKGYTKAFDRLETATEWEAVLIAELINLRDDRRIRSATQARIYRRSICADHRSQGLRYLTAGQNNTRRAQRVMNG